MPTPGHLSGDGMLYLSGATRTDSRDIAHELDGMNGPPWNLCRSFWNCAVCSDNI